MAMTSSGKGLISMSLDHASATKLVGDDGAVTAIVEPEFDVLQKPPFTLGQIRAAIPKHCWERAAWRAPSATSSRTWPL
jgi:hypothetical protein